MRSSSPKLPEGSWLASDGKAYDLGQIAKRSRALVVTFFSSECPCQEAHDRRLRALATRDAPMGVAFLAVDVAPDTSLEKAQDERTRRGYPFPILVDSSGALADALGAEVATYSVVIDPAGSVRYHGGIDSDRTHLTSDAEPWLSDAIDGVLRGSFDLPSEERALGCELRRR